MYTTVRNFEFSPVFSQNTNTQNSLSELKPDERACYETIAKELLLCCARRWEHPTLAPPSNLGDRVYAIVFKQSESWRDLENRFTILDTKVFEPKVKEWIKSWRERINSIRNLHHQIHDYNAERIRLLEERAKFEDRYPEECFQHLDLTVKLTLGRMAAAQQEVKNILTTAEQQLESDRKNPEFIEKEECQNLLNFLIEKWFNLTVFSEWLEVPMDKKRLCVRVYDPSKSPLLNIEKLIKDIGIKEQESKEKRLNNPTKAIILIKETEIEEQPINGNDNGKQPSKVIRPKGIGVKGKHFAGASPMSKKSGPETDSSPFQLTEDLLFGCQIDITSLARRIEEIAELSLQKVNEILRTYEGSQLNDTVINKLIKNEKIDKNENGQETSWSFSSVFSVMKTFLGL